MRVMAGIASESSIFPYFPYLPPEIRTQIWRDSLPGADPPALSFCKKGCWKLIYPPPECESETSGSENEDQDPLNRCCPKLEFCHHLLDNIQVNIPLFWVNREARGVTLAWAREQKAQGVFFENLEEEEHPDLLRPFDPTKDILYVPTNKLQEFYAEPWHITRYARGWFAPNPDVLHIALSEPAWNEIPSIYRILDLFPQLEILFIVVGLQPHLKTEDSMAVRRRWELRDTQGRAVMWRHDQAKFEPKNIKEPADEILELWIKRANRWHNRRVRHDFEIRPVVATRK